MILNTLGTKLLASAIPKCEAAAEGAQVAARAVRQRLQRQERIRTSLIAHQSENLRNES